jgi:imidazoleglycerol-phosphate dehydratase
MPRTAQIHRKTGETDIRISLTIEGRGSSEISTKIPFFDHMLTLFARHSLVDLNVQADGDIDVDFHHTVEDTGIALGQAFTKALGDKRGIRRYGSATIPMDEACVTCAIDLSGRTFFVSKLDLPKAKVGEFDSELADVFFEGLARGAQCNLHLYKLAGENLHHQIEISFKALARALRDACEIDPRAGGELPSTKGTLTE